MLPDTDRVTRRAVLRLGGGALTAGLAGCLSNGGANSTATTAASPDGTATATRSPTPSSGPADWRQVELTDVTTGTTFTIDQFEGQPVLLEFFAVWCPVCTKQQKVLREVTEQLSDVVVISLNTDPNEDADRIRSHLDEHQEFDWRYAIAPSAMTQSLIDQFGSVIATPPAAPVVRMCPDGASKLVAGRGVKPAEDLVDAVEQC